MNKNPHLNPKHDPILERGIAALRAESSDESGIQSTVLKMLEKPKSRPARMVGFRYVAIGGAAAALAAVTFWPGRVEAASIQKVIDAVQQYQARFEEVLKPDANGQMKVYLEIWGEPGKYAELFDNGWEIRGNGITSYAFYPEQKYQRIKLGPAMEIDPVGVESFAQFKLLRVEKDGAMLRYVYNIRQDLIVDPKTNLPTERVVYNQDGSVMEIHRYHFKADLDDRIFDPAVKPGFPLYDIDKERRQVIASLSKPQTKIVNGIKINLHAVMVDRIGNISAIVTGGAARKGSERVPLAKKGALQVDGQPAGFALTTFEDSMRGEYKPSLGNPLIFNGKRYRKETVFWPSPQTIPNTFTLRVPVWQLDPSLPLLDVNSKKRIGSDSRLVGWAEFKVTNAIRTEGLDAVLPNFKPMESEGTAVSVSKAENAVPPRK